MTHSPNSHTGQVERRTVLRWSLSAAAVGALVPPLAMLDTRSAYATVGYTVPNPSFEVLSSNPSFPASWGFGASGSGSSGALDSTVHRTGLYAFKTTAPSASDRYTVQQYMKPATPGVKYAFSVWYKVSAGLTVAPSLQLYFHAANQSQLAYIGRVGSRTASAWTRLVVEGTAPAGTAFFTISLCNYYSQGTVWWDDVDGGAWRPLTPRGGTYLVRTSSTDTLTLSLATSARPAPIREIRIGSNTYSFTGATTVAGPSGTMTWTAPGTTWNASTSSVTLPANWTGSLTVTNGTIAAPAGSAFPEVVLISAFGGTDTVYAIASGYGAPNHTSELAQEPAALTALAAASNYLETLRLPDGSTLIHHPTWPGDPQPDPHGLASLANLNTRLFRLTNVASYRDRARATLTWLASAQLTNGGFGFPWAYGATQSHYTDAAHYPPGTMTHPAGAVMAIITANAGSALLEGYQAFGDGAFRTAADKAVQYLFTDPTNGMKYLDGGTTYASIPYCTHTPVGSGMPSSYQVYNVDGAALALLTQWRTVTGATTYTTQGDAIAANLTRRIESDGSVVYGYHNLGKPTGYAYIVYAGLLRWGVHRSRSDWVAIARRGISWMTNMERPSELLWESYGSALGGVDNTQDVVTAIGRYISSQHADGSWSPSTQRSTRSDAGNGAVLAALLVQARGLD